VTSRLLHGFDWFIRFLSRLAWFVVIFLVVAISSDVALRYFFSRPLPWVTSFSEFSLVYLTFLGAPLLLRKNEHVSLEVLVSHLSPKTQTLLIVLTSILGALVCLTIAIAGTYISWDLYRRHVMVADEMGVPQWPIVAIIPLSCLLLAIEFLRMASSNFPQFKRPPESKSDKREI
jgi:C4-dicarboxylate transporter DctQ subunit